jgi:hypothetical protein
MLVISGVALAVWAVAGLDFPARDAEFLAASGQVGVVAAGTGKLVPAVLAGLRGNAELSDTHNVVAFR